MKKKIIAILVIGWLLTTSIASVNAFDVGSDVSEEIKSSELQVGNSGSNSFYDEHSGDDLWYIAKFHSEQKVNFKNVWINSTCDRNYDLIGFHQWIITPSLVPEEFWYNQIFPEFWIGEYDIIGSSIRVGGNFNGTWYFIALLGNFRNVSFTFTMQTEELTEYSVDVEKGDGCKAYVGDDFEKTLVNKGYSETFMNFYEGNNPKQCTFETTVDNGEEVITYNEEELKAQLQDYIDETNRNDIEKTDNALTRKYESEEVIIPYFEAEFEVKTDELLNNEQETEPYDEVIKIDVDNTLIGWFGWECDWISYAGGFGCSKTCYITPSGKIVSKKTWIIFSSILRLILDELEIVIPEEDHFDDNTLLFSEPGEWQFMGKIKYEVGCNLTICLLVADVIIPGDDNDNSNEVNGDLSQGATNQNSPSGQQRQGTQGQSTPLGTESSRPINS